jgi:hypothetical protein
VCFKRAETSAYGSESSSIRGLSDRDSLVRHKEWIGFWRNARRDVRLEELLGRIGYIYMPFLEVINDREAIVSIKQ